jgi:hypothetical protein
MPKEDRRRFNDPSKARAAAMEGAAERNARDPKALQRAIRILRAAEPWAW